jgi:hypothetical protein
MLTQVQKIKGEGKKN